MLDKIKALANENSKYQIYLCYILMLVVLCTSIVAIHFLINLVFQRMNEIVPFIKLWFDNLPVSVHCIDKYLFKCFKCK